VSDIAQPSEICQSRLPHADTTCIVLTGSAHEDTSNASESPITGPACDADALQGDVPPASPDAANVVHASSEVDSEDSEDSEQFYSQEEPSESDAELDAGTLLLEPVSFGIEVPVDSG
jgi:hypothetical protein